MRRVCVVATLGFGCAPGKRAARSMQRMACNAQRATHEMACLPAPIDCNAHSFARCSFSAIVVLVTLYLLALLAFLVRWPIKALSHLALSRLALSHLAGACG